MTTVPLCNILTYWADQHADDALALVHEGRRVTWCELDAASNKLARAYEKLGVEKNDFVTIALPNSIEFFTAIFATWKLGATPQPVSAKLPKFERDQIIELCEPSLVVGVPDGDHPDCTTVPIEYDAADHSNEQLGERMADSFKAMTSGGSTGRPKLIVSTSLGASCGGLGLALAYQLDIAAGGSIVLLATAVFFASALLGRGRA